MKQLYIVLLSICTITYGMGPELQHKPLEFHQPKYYESQRPTPQVQPGGQLIFPDLSQLRCEGTTLKSSYAYDFSDLDHTQISGWMDRDSWVFPFMSNPDMSQDPEIKQFEEAVDKYDIADLEQSLRMIKDRLENLSCLDRNNRYKNSRRLSFLIKNVHMLKEGSKEQCIAPIGGQIYSLSDSQAFDAKADMVTTTPSRVVDIHPKVDQQVERVMQELREQYSDFDEYQEAAFRALEEMHRQGLLTPPIDVVQQVLAHGTIHFFKSLVPTNPLAHPREFTINLVKYTALGAIHSFTNGVLIPVQTAAMVAMKAQQLQEIDTSKMTPNDYAKLVAEELADLAYTVASTKLATKAKDVKIPEGFVRMTREMFKGNDPQVAIAGGEGSTSVSVPEDSTVQPRSTEKVRSGGAKTSNISRVETVANMKQVFEMSDFGRALKKGSVKTKLIDAKTNSQIYEVTQKIPEFGLDKGDHFYLDKFHGDHIEVFNKKGRCTSVLNLDGSINKIKADKAVGRPLRIK